MSNTSTDLRNLAHVIPAIATSDGAGVKLRRSIGSQRGLYLDPFLMLDEFGTDNPGDYIAGFPAHPHRGFETVTYMLDGRMQHKDHLGNVGDLGPGGVQWMTAGRGVIHSEMPLQESGRMRGFQLWINLPSAEKMKPAGYRDIPASEIPQAALPGGGSIKVIAGTAEVGEARISGPINSPAQPLSTAPLYFDLELPAGALFEQPIPAGHNAFLYTYEGSVEVAGKSAPAQAALVLGAGERLSLRAGPQGARLILLAGKPLREPVVQYGPFVMNSREEIEQALRDYQNGVLTEAAA
ncbi:pirin family protein [Stagnimonas aquatica]|uniref:Pirin family protein n=1 Tax=Stagnimonas aquatica TaxID=2689987 RepID=A0A3N0VLC1_9GAMM|nr:pirin family protein [Stagnimonas aquatica]ROH93537.1 pirin family protein [Stagnimonas aquatica]